MTKAEDFKLLKIQVCSLRVNIHCDGCKQKVKKLLQRIEGVYQVHIDAEQKKVTVLGVVDSATLIKKLIRAGKHAELWSQKTNQIQKQKANCIKDDKGNKGQKQGLFNGLEALKNQQKFPFNLEEDEDYLDNVDDEGDELRFLTEKANQINLLRQQAATMQGNNGKKGFGTAMTAAGPAAAPNNGKMANNPGNGNTGKKGNHHPNQNMGMKANPGGLDQKTMHTLKMNNAQFGSGANVNIGEGKMGNDINSMMNLAGFHGNGVNSSSASVLEGNSGIGSGGVYHHHRNQVQPNAFMGASSAGMIPTGGMATGHHPSAMMMNMNGGGGGYQQQQQQQQQQYNHPSSSMLMSLQNRHALQQAQMMYNRSPFIPTSTGYYYSYGPPVPPYAYMMTSADPCYNHNLNGDHSAATDIFSDEKTGSCSIM